MFRGETGRSGFACAPAYGSEVVALGDGFIPGTEVPGYLEALCASVWVWDLFLLKCLQWGGWSGVIPCLYETWGTRS